MVVFGQNKIENTRDVRLLEALCINNVNPREGTYSISSFYTDECSIL